MCSSVRVSVLLALVALLHLGDATVEKFSECCKSTSREEIPGKVTGILPQRRNGNCVNAIIVQMDEKSLFCVHPGAEWVKPHAEAYLEKLKLNRAKTQTPPTKRSLLSMLTTSPSRAPLPTSEPDTSSSSSSFISSSTAPPPPSSTTSIFSSTSSSVAEEISSGEIDDMN